jgi:hypothetical protein
VIGGVLAALPVSAANAVTDAQASVGRVTVYETTNFTGGGFTHVYSRCAGQVVSVPGLAQAGSFDNRPATGCLVTLVTTHGSYELCEGRAVVPAPFRDASALRIQPGVARPCLR